AAEQRGTAVHRPAEAVEDPAAQGGADRYPQRRAGGHDRGTGPDPGQRTHRQAADPLAVDRDHLGRYRVRTGTDADQVADPAGYPGDRDGQPDHGADPADHLRPGGPAQCVEPGYRAHRPSSARTRAIASARRASIVVVPCSATASPGDRLGSGPTRMVRPAMVYSPSGA